MKTISWKKLLPYVVAIALFIAIPLVYLNPLFSGKVLRQDDIIRHKGMAKEIRDFRAKTGEEPLWTNSMFSGMPAYQISVEYKSNLARFADKIFTLALPHPAGLVFLYMLGFFILLTVLRVDPWLSIAGAVAYGLSSYFFIILQAGHNSKAHAIGYMAPVLAGIILTYRGKYMLGGLIAAFFLSLELYANHPQITYYLMLLVILFGMTELYTSIKNNRIPGFLKATAVVFIAAVFALLSNITSLWTTYEYGKETIRGKSELSTNKENRTSGLDKDYATRWSYGIGESFTLLIPNFNGGSSTGRLGENSATFKALTENQVPRNQAEQFISAAPTYWGTQPFTSGPVYAGAIVIFLFVAGIFLLKGDLKWWLVAGTALSLFLAWGKNFPFLTDLFLDYFPGYNKFRAVTMILVVAELTLPLMAFFALDKFLEIKADKKLLLKPLKLSLYIAGGLTLFFAILGPSLFSFSGPGDASYSESYPGWLMSAILSDRISLFRMDALRSLVMILLTAATLWAYLAGKIKRGLVLAIIPALVLLDMWPVNKRYLNNDDFMPKLKLDNPYTRTKADELILKDPDPNFRVLNLSTDPFADAATSYFHKSIGGYHGAKLRRYEELYYNQIRDKNNYQVLNMLNTRYIIQADEKRQLTVIPNTEALGNAWFVREYRTVKNADEELDALTGFDPETTAIVDERFLPQIGNFLPGQDSAGTIRLTDYKPNHLTYESTASSDRLAVFSEIYYDKGWNAYIDGQKSDYFRANYVLRAMVVPSGQHRIEFRFEPSSYRTGERISLFSSMILLLAFFGGLGFLLYRGQGKMA